MTTSDGRTGFGPGDNTAASPHRARGTSVEHSVSIRSREQATVSGVLRVASFDDQQVVLETSLGVLTMLGQGLQIKQLDLTEGSFRIEGHVDSLIYTDTHPSAHDRRKGSRGHVLGRLFR